MIHPQSVYATQEDMMPAGRLVPVSIMIFFVFTSQLEHFPSGPRLQVQVTVAAGGGLPVRGRIDDKGQPQRLVPLWRQPLCPDH
jgi:hypothetical protein